MIWHGLISASAPTDDRPKVMAGFTNGTLQVRGEVERRRGFARSTMAKLDAAWANFSGFAEYQGQVFAMAAYGDKLEGFLNPGALWSDSQQTLLSGFYSLSGGVYTIVILRNGNQFSTGATIVARPGRCPGSFLDGQLVASIPLPASSGSVVYTWTPPTPGDWRFSAIPTLNGISGPADCLSVIANLFVFAGYNGAIPNLFYSPSGATFSTASRASGHPPNLIEAAAFNLASATWVYSMDGGYSAHSTDGITWTAGGTTPLEAQALFALSDGTMVALMNEALPRTYISTDNGATWTMTGTASALPFTLIGFGCDGKNLGFVDSASRVFNSSNRGLTWPLVGSIGAGTVIKGLARGGGQWIAFGNLSLGGAAVWTSPDLATWTPFSGPAGWVTVQGAVYGNGKWLLSGNGGAGATGAVTTTTDFVTYTGGATLIAGQGVNALAYSLGIFAIACSSNNSSNIFTTTGNGVYTTHSVGTNAATGALNAPGTGAWAGLGL